MCFSWKINCKTVSNRLKKISEKHAKSMFVFTEMTFNGWWAKIVDVLKTSIFLSLTVDIWTDIHSVI